MNVIKHVVVPGTFDPVTLGHLDVMVRAKRLFDTVTVAVAHSKNKGGSGPIFSLEERKALIETACLEHSELAGEFEAGKLRVLTFEGLLVDFCHEVQAQGVVKGLRAMTDFEYELQQADLNARMAPGIESVFIMSAPEYGFVSSSAVKDIASFGGSVDILVPPCVKDRLQAYYRQR